MISWIVASHRDDVLNENLLATLKLADGDELVVMRNRPSIAVAYNEGQARATRPVRCFIHHDVQIIDPEGLRRALLRHCVVDVGIVGVIGSTTRSLPWWEGICRGSVVDGRMGLLNMGPGGEVAYLDGLLLATVHDLTWDESYDGFHLYDHDICRQQLESGRVNWCIDGGADLVLHNTTGPADTARLTGWDAGVARFRDKWGT